MVKAPSSHGLDRKFKPWRRGKSVNSKGSSKTGASLKRQLRGLQRLYDEKTKLGGPDEKNEQRGKQDDDTPDPLKDLRSKIEELQQQIASKNVSEKERVNAKKSHKMRFVERQKTTRLYKHLLQQKISKIVEDELYKLALDQVYIAHYPLDHSSYLSLYHNNARRTNMNCRLLYKMAHQRRRVLDRLPTVQRVNWIPAEQYERVFANMARQQHSWSTDLERTTFGITVTDAGTNTDKTTDMETDNRFVAVSEQAKKLVEEQEKMEQDLARNEEASKSAIASYAMRVHFDDDDNNSDDDELSSSDDNADPLAKTSPSTGAQTTAKQSAAMKDDSNESRGQNAGDSSSSDDSEEYTSRKPVQNNSGTVENDSDDDSTSSSSSRSSSSSSSSSSNHSSASVPQKKEQLTTTKSINKTAVPPQPLHDDFFVAADDDVDVFANAKRHVPAMDDAKGDKSKGWATQRLPGQFRKKQRR